MKHAIAKERPELKALIILIITGHVGTLVPNGWRLFYAKTTTRSFSGYSHMTRSRIIFRRHRILWSSENSHSPVGILSSTIQAASLNNFDTMGQTVHFLPVNISTVDGMAKGLLKKSITTVLNSSGFSIDPKCVAPGMINRLDFLML